MSIGQDQDVDHRKLFVGALSWDTNEDSFKRYFSKYGEVQEAVIKLDKVTQRPRGFGFVTFVDQSSIEAVIMDPTHVLDGKTIDPKRATAKNAIPPPMGRSVGVGVGGGGGGGEKEKVFVGGIPPLEAGETVESLQIDLKALLESKLGEGTVKEVEIKLDPAGTGRHRGFGFVTFDMVETAEVACQTHFYTLHNKSIEIKKADSKRARQGGSGYGGGQYAPYGGGAGGGNNYHAQQQWGDGYGAAGYGHYNSGGTDYSQMYPYQQQTGYPQQQQQGAHHGTGNAQMGGYADYYAASAQAAGDSTAASYGGHNYQQYSGGYAGHQGSHQGGYAAQPQQQQHQQPYYSHHPTR